MLVVIDANLSRHAVLRLSVRCAMHRNRVMKLQNRLGICHPVQRTPPQGFESRASSVFKLYTIRELYKQTRYVIHNCTPGIDSAFMLVWEQII